MSQDVREVGRVSLPPAACANNGADKKKNVMEPSRARLHATWKLISKRKPGTSINVTRAQHNPKENWGLRSEQRINKRPFNSWPETRLRPADEVS